MTEIEPRALIALVDVGEETTRLPIDAQLLTAGLRQVLEDCRWIWVDVELDSLIAMLLTISRIETHQI